MFTALRTASARRTAGAAAAALLAVSLAGCSLVEVPEPAPLSGIAACALGSTWSLDTAKLAEAITAEFATRGAAITAASEGSQTITWGLDSKMAIDTDYTVTLTSGAADQVTVVTQEHKGKSTGIAYINAEVAIPRDWDGTGLNVKTTATLNGAPLDPVPYTAVQTDIDDSVGVELTCDGGTMTTHQRGSDITLTWAKK